MLPALCDRVISMAPSAGSWLRAHAAPPPDRRHVTLARGPGLASDGAEVPLVARLYDDVTVLADTEATAEKVLHALDGTWLAHKRLHRFLRAGQTLAESVYHVRRRVGGDPVQQATAASLVTLGAG
jgi:hypothetical protein